MTSFAEKIAQSRAQFAPRPEAQSVLDAPRPEAGIAAGYTRDFFVPMEYVNGANTPPILRDLSVPCAALALHGHLPPGAFALAVPRELRGDLIRFFSNADSLDQWSWGGNQFDAPGSVIDHLPEGVIIMYPGDVVPLGKPALNGVSIWVSAGPFNNPGTPINLIQLGAEPYVRVFQTTSGLPARMGYRPVPFFRQIETLNTTTPPPGNALAVGAAIYGCTHVRITIIDNASLTPVQAGESGSFEVWWMNSRGLWMHHDSDDFDAAGRGAASDTHSSETYDIPVGALAVYVTRTAGANTLWHIIEGFDARGAYRP